MVLLDAGDADVVVAPITSRSHGSPYDVAIVRWRAANLRRPSTIRLHKVATVHRGLVHGRLGVLRAVDRRQVGSALDGLCRNLVTTLRR
jgi:mRNA interferase MazF